MVLNYILVGCPWKFVYHRVKLPRKELHTNMENLKQATEEIKAKVRSPEFVSRIVCCVALVTYNSYEIIRAAVLRKLFDNRFSYIQTLLFRTRLPLTRQYGFQNRDKVYMSPIQFCSRKSLSFPLLGITSPSVFDTGYKLELTGYRTNLGLTSVKVFTWR